MFRSRGRGCAMRVDGPHVDNSSGPEGPRRRRPRTEAQMYCAVALCCFGMLLMGAGFVVEPMGSISSSVLVGYGEVMTFAGALFGIDYHSRL